MNKMNRQFGVAKPGYAKHVFKKSRTTNVEPENIETPKAVPTKKSGYKRLNLRKAVGKSAITVNVNLLNQFYQNNDDINKILKFIKAVVEIEMNDNEFMINSNIIENAKIKQLTYFLQNSKFKDNFDKAIRDDDESLALTLLMFYDPEVYPEKWENETKRLTSSIINTREPNSAETCVRCKKNTVYAFTRQVRSADEGATNFFECLNCGKVWSEN